MEVSSHDNQVPQGVAPPAQLELVFERIRWAEMMVPLELNRSTETPPPPLPTSELDAYIQPVPFGKTAPPSGALCQV